MRATPFADLNDHDLLTRLDQVIARDRANTAELIALIAEVDERKLYLPAGFPSMRDYCIGKLGLSEDAAYKRIQVARAAREFPEILERVADGRIHLTGALLLASKLTPGNANELFQATEHRTKAEIELLLARRFPQSESLPMVYPVPGSPSGSCEPLAPERVDECQADTSEVGESSNPLAPGRVASRSRAARLAPIAAERFELYVTIDQATYDSLRQAQELLSHSIPSGDIAQVLGRALKSYVAQLQKRKFGATDSPRPRRRKSSSDPRHIPADVKRAVWERDGGQCTFVGEDGHRCPSRAFIEFDHVDPVARGGQATVDSVRLLCRFHNQLMAERLFGAGFMAEKREEARRAAEMKQELESRNGTDALAPPHAEDHEADEAAHERLRVAAEDERARNEAEEQARDVMCGSKNLGFETEQACRGAEFSVTLPAETTLEERFRAAIKFLCPKRSQTPVEASRQSAA